MNNKKVLQENPALCDDEVQTRQPDNLPESFENMSMPCQLLDVNGIITHANSALLDLLGYTDEEYIAQPIDKFCIGRKAFQEISSRRSQKQGLLNFAAVLKCKNGSLVNVLLTADPVKSNNGFTYLQCFVTDVSILKKGDDEKDELLANLEHSEARLKMALEYINLGTWDFNPISGELIWSDECRRIYGVEPDTVISFELFADHISSKDREAVLEKLQQVMNAGSSGLYDNSHRIIRFDDNTERWIRSQGKVYFNNQGKPQRFIGTVADITDSKLAEEKSARLVAIVESSDDAIISKTLDGVITSWNDSAKRIFGYSADEIIGQSVLKLIPDDRKNEEPQILARLRRGERVDHFETKRITKYNKLLDLSLTISPVKDFEGNIIGVSKIARDITDKKREEAKKNDFIAMVSHELKTPLTSIKSYIQVLLAQAKKDGDSFRTHALTRTEVQVKKMVNMVSDFLNLARLEEAKININKEYFNLKPLIEEIVSEAKLLTAYNDIVISGCDLTLFADKEKIGQVLTNLISNAIKYSPEGGTIAIGSEKTTDGVKIFVSDNGIGIALVDQKKLFERFYRVENEKLKNVSGFGVGLYLVAELLRYHDSEIKIESSEGKGSTFYFFMKEDLEIK
ncbi:PAS domain S-box protein [Pedobacter sp. HMF7647]|uniref:histidine kinase n=1 Tax=Hufsiella arboris TaxID=2695275 RepID=A0A7K1YBV7_9SPHI|nr:PAS domain S-box protein [Hufsiella arboris]MXV52055.1 PAS domain S-box protein [Hufsiella arboris]